MKLVIAGASGFVAAEVIRQSLSLPQITSVVALARRPVSAPDNLRPGADTSKLHSAVIQDYDEYPNGVKTQLADADACIYTVGITPTKARSMDWAVVRRVSHDYTLASIKVMVEARGSATKPLRWLYMSGIAGERDQTKTPRLMEKYCLMRLKRLIKSPYGKTENELLEFAAEHPSKVDVFVAKPGLITQPGNFATAALGTVLQMVGIIPKISVTEVAAAMLDQVIKGFEKKPLMHEDLVRIGKAELKP